MGFRQPILFSWGCRSSVSPEGHWGCCTSLSLMSQPQLCKSPMRSCPFQRTAFLSLILKKKARGPCKAEALRSMDGGGGTARARGGGVRIAEPATRPTAASEGHRVSEAMIRIS